MTHQCIARVFRLSWVIDIDDLVRTTRDDKTIGELCAGFDDTQRIDKVIMTLEDLVWRKEVGAGSCPGTNGLVTGTGDKSIV
jgi:hypothetical protein